MSVFEPSSPSASSPDPELPNFPVVVRGYDRQRVRAFVDDLAAQLAAERRRVEAAQRAMVQMRAELTAARNQQPLSFEHLGSEAARVLEQAGRSAKLLVEEATGRGDVIVTEARAHAAEIVEQAEQRAAQIDSGAREMLTEATAERDRILAEAEDEAHRMRSRAEEQAGDMMDEARRASEAVRAEANAERAEVEAATQRLRQSRNSVLEYLNRIHSDLGLLLDEVAATDQDGMPAQGRGEAPEPTMTEPKAETAVVESGAEALAAPAHPAEAWAANQN